MAGKPKYTEHTISPGVTEFRLNNWKWFSDFINKEMLDYTTYIYRGHGNSNWDLKPSIDRLSKPPSFLRRMTLLNTFKFSSRGRRGINPPQIEKENDWWALGRHHGLLTPLLDWTESPFVALYFAMISAKKVTSTNCCVWGISQTRIDQFSNNIKEDDSIESINGRKPIVEIIRPLSDENSRMVNQRGLFTRAPDNTDLRDWIKKHSDKKKVIDIMKIIMPRKGIDDCLRYLNRMNINHATLFPDLYGASSFCNMELTINNY